jgi:hypothetical protein
LSREEKPFPPGIDLETFQQLSPSACKWAKAQEEFILAQGSTLNARAAADAKRVGVRHPEYVRVLVVDRIPLPEDAQLAEASRRTDIITESSRAVAIGYGIIVRGDCWGVRELLLHQLVHVAQRERCGSLEAFVQKYLTDRHSAADFTIGALEEEARRLAREICAADAAKH